MAKKVLIIEDEKPMAKALEVKLNADGLEAKAVFGGKEGIAELESGSYDLVLLDIMMPVVDGWAVLTKIKEKGIKTKVVITSNLSQEEDIEKAKKLGATDFLVKSDSTLDDIVNKIKAILGS